jgi:hypothetical protein
MVVTWGLSMLAVIILMLTPLSGDRWITMLATGVVLLVLSVSFAISNHRSGIK